MRFLVAIQRLIMRFSLDKIKVENYMYYVIPNEYILRLICSLQLYDRPICRHIFEQIRDRIAFRLELTGIKRDSAGCLRPKGKRMVHIVFVKSAAFDFFGGKIFGKLVNDGGYHFHMRQFFRTYIVPGNVPDQALWGQVQCFRLICT